MRAISGTHWMVACALALGACALDAPPGDDDSPADNSATVDDAMTSASTSAEASADTPSDVDIPDELSFENLPELATTGDDDGLRDGCHVRILSCGRHHHRPRYCTYGYCKYSPRRQARRVCYHVCGHHARCDRPRYVGRCHHPHLDGDEDLAPDQSEI
jgi:hypothetical protein